MGLSAYMATSKNASQENKFNWKDKSCDIFTATTWKQNTVTVAVFHGPDAVLARVTQLWVEPMPIGRGWGAMLSTHLRVLVTVELELEQCPLSLQETDFFIHFQGLC